MLKKFRSVRFYLTIALILSLLFAGFSMYYKICYWGFSLEPKELTNVWAIETHITFNPTGDPIKVSISRPNADNTFKILDEDVVAPKYAVHYEKDRVILTNQARRKEQNIYYRVLVYDNQNGKGKEYAPAPQTPNPPVFDEQSRLIVRQLLLEAAQLEGNPVQQLIRLFNQEPPNQTVLAFMPDRKSAKNTALMLKDILALQGIPTRLAWGIKLSEDKKSFSADVMLEAYLKDKWDIYDITTAQKGIPKDFIIFQRGGESLVDVEGGENSVTKFSVIKSISTSFNMASHRAKLLGQKNWFDYSIYSLPIAQQNALKWLMIFPLAILVVVILRNVVGLKTMGTFTPMLIAMALVQTGFLPGLICFALIVGIGFAIRMLLSKLNLLLVPRISAVVIFVILIMQVFAVLGYQWHLEIASSALFFPIIIMAWIIERASIIWEEEGIKNATKEVFFSVIVAILTYFVIVNPYIRYIMFAFNELNLVILCLVMLLGTYTGYRLTELIRFAPISRNKTDV